MKHLLNKTLTVKQILAVIILPVAILSTALVFSTGGEPLPIANTKEVKDSIVSAPVYTDTTTLKDLTGFVDSINNSDKLFAGSWSFYLCEADSGTAICDVNIDMGLVPASVMKIVSTGTALAILGPKHRFPTFLQYDGSIDPLTKTLLGNIIIRGGGDPALGAETFGSSIEKVENEWITAIKKLGIDSIAGCIIGDADACDRDPVPMCWTWQDMQSDYGTGACGLNIHENVYEMDLSASNGNVSIKTNPKIPGMKLYNQVVHNPSVGKSYAYVQGAPFQFERIVLGEVAGELKERGAIPDPALFCAQSLKAALISAGVRVRDSATTIRIMRLNNIKTAAKETKKPILTLYSPPLEDLVYHTNQISQNFYAESILRGISLSENGYGNTQSSVNSIYKYWKEKKIDLRGLCMVDGSGLSRMNTITTRQLVEMLRVFSKDPGVFPTFYESLPVAGESGTIRKLAHGTSAEGNLHAKSGTMSRVKSYVGYVRTKSGKLLCFALIGNNTQWTEVELKFKFERIFELMAELP